MYYAQITGGVVTAVTETSGPVDSPNMVAIGSMDTSLLGHSYAGGAFAPVAPPVAPWTKKEFLLKFTPAEYAEIKFGAAASPTLDYYWTLFNVADNVLKTDPSTIGGIQALEAAGILAVGRSAEILA
jgi:hypothetical protein